MTRKSMRELEDDISDLERADSDVAGLITVLSTACSGGAVEDVPGRRDLVRIDGERMRLTENAREKLFAGGRQR